MVHDRVTIDVTRVVWTAAVLWYGKQMENYHVITFAGWSVSKNRDKVLEVAPQICEIMQYETVKSEGFGCKDWGKGLGGGTVIERVLKKWDWGGALIRLI